MLRIRAGYQGQPVEIHAEFGHCDGAEVGEPDRGAPRTRRRGAGCECESKGGRPLVMTAGSGSDQNCASTLDGTSRDQVSDARCQREGALPGQGERADPVGQGVERVWTAHASRLANTRSIRSGGVM